VEGRGQHERAGQKETGGEAMRARGVCRYCDERTWSGATICVTCRRVGARGIFWGALIGAALWEIIKRALG
jgi:hypothetical protein